MGATLIVDDPELALVLSGTNLPTTEGQVAVKKTFLLVLNV